MDVAQLHLNPGEMHVGTRPTVVSTILGSCVSVTLFHPASRMGAICHGLLPECRCDHPEQCRGRSCPDCLRYVDCAIIAMLREFDRRRIPRRALEVKLFGGSDLLPNSSGQEHSIGRQNVAMAREILHEEGLAVMAEDVGGARGRKILFHTHTGEVLLKRLQRTAAGWQQQMAAMQSR